jgi:hypothetical protein
MIGTRFLQAVTRFADGNDIPVVGWTPNSRAEVIQAPTEAQLPGTRHTFPPPPRPPVKCNDTYISTVITICTSSVRLGP